MKSKYLTINNLIYGLFGVLIVLALIMRYALIHYTSQDYIYYISPWYDDLKLNGLREFKYNFSNYNAPYLYLVYIATILPISKIIALKSISILFDLLLAYSVYLIVKIFRPEKYVAMGAGTLTLFLPTVFINSAFWGQVDALYTTFIMYSLYFLLKDRSRLAWLFWGVSLAFKLQAIFFLPVLVIMVFKRIKWYDSAYAIAAFLILSVGPIFEGRSAISILKTYFVQSQTYSSLTLNAPNWYQWISNNAFKYFNSSGIFLTLAAVVFISLISLIHKKYGNRETLLVTCLLLFVVPFLLPQMHERYFYPAEIASLILAFVYPVGWAIAVSMQVITIMAYAPFLFGHVVIPLSILAIFVLFIIFILYTLYIYGSLPVGKTIRTLVGNSEP